MIKKFFIILNNIDYQFKIKFFVLNFIYILNSIFQSVYIISITPIISQVLSKDKNKLSFIINKIINFGNNFFDNQIVILLVFFIAVSLIANIFLVLLNFINFSFNQNLLSNCRKKLFSKYANSDYLYINSKNLSFYNTIILQQVDRLVNNVFGSLNLIIQNIFAVVMILISISYVIKDSIIGFAILFFLFFTVCIFFSKKYFSTKGEHLNDILKGRLDILNKLILNFKEVQIFGFKKILLDQYVVFENKFNRNIKYTSFFNHSTKPLIEIIAVVGFSLLIFTNFSFIFSADFIITFSLIVFALYKILPSANVIYTSINQINFDKTSINKIYDEMFREIQNVKLFEDNDLQCNQLNSLTIKNLNFGYDEDDIIKNFNYEFKVNNFYLIKGPSGTGKSTLLNLLIGILPFRSGEIFYNNQKFINYNNPNWFKNISYVPQKITLLNNTIKENITFSFNNDFDKKKYENALRDTNLYEEFFNRENETINEFTSNISGGQAQRIGLARALYRDSKIIFLDEPTSNLDEENENKFLNLVNTLKNNRIIIMISHKKHENVIFDEIINF